MQKKSMAMTLVACLLILALCSSAPVLGNLWGGVTAAATICGDTKTSLIAGGGALGSALLWGGICAFGVSTAGVGFAIGAGIAL